MCSIFLVYTILAIFARGNFMDEKTIQAAETILKQGHRVELIPVKDGIKVIRVRREEVKK